MNKKNIGFFGLILLIIGCIVTFINTLIGFIITVLAFAVSLSNIGKKNFIIKLTLVLSIIAMCVQVFMIVVAYKVINDSRNNENNNVSNMFISHYENRFKSNAEYYFYRKVLTNQKLESTSELFATMSEIDENIKGCDGYAVYNIETKETKVYIKCENYETPGFDDSKMK